MRCPPVTFTAGTLNLSTTSAIFFWFVAYNGIEAFFTLYTQNHLGLPGEDGARFIGQLGLIFVVFALPAGYLGGRFGRRKTIMTGIVLMGALMLALIAVYTRSQLALGIRVSSTIW